MDDHDPTLNNPALDLEDSDDDAEWNPVKEAEKSGKRKRGGDSSDEEYTEFNNLHNNKLKNKRRAGAYLDGAAANSIQNRKLSSNSETNTDTQVPDGQDFKVEFKKIKKNIFPLLQLLQIGTFLILKSEQSSSQPSLWRVDGRSLIQKFSCWDQEKRLYKCVNTYSGWTSTTRHKYRPVEVRHSKSEDGDDLVELVENQTETETESPRRDAARPTTKKFNVE